MVQYDYGSVCHPYAAARAVRATVAARWHALLVRNIDTYALFVRHDFVEWIDGAR